MGVRVGPGDVVVGHNAKHAADLHFLAHHFIFQNMVAGDEERADGSGIVGIAVLGDDPVGLVLKIDYRSIIALSSIICSS